MRGSKIEAAVVPDLYVALIAEPRKFPQCPQHKLLYLRNATQVLVTACQTVTARVLVVVVRENGDPHLA